MANILPNTDGGLLTADALAFVDLQPQMSFGVASGIDRQLLVNNVLLLAKAQSSSWRASHPDDGRN